MCPSYLKSKPGSESSLRRSAALRSRAREPSTSRRSRRSTHRPPPSSGARSRARAVGGRTCSSPPLDGELILRVHLMSAGRLRYVPPGGKTPKKSMFRIRFEDAGELVLTEAGNHRRAGVWLSSPAALEEELAHLGPDALELDAAQLAHDPPARAQAAPPAPPRPARARRDRPRACQRDPLAGAALAVSPVPRSQRRRGRACSPRRSGPISTGRSQLREQGKGDADIYAVHGRFGEPCPACGDTLRRVAFEEHTITYCATCQTDGKVLKDRRLSRLLR